MLQNQKDKELILPKVCSEGKCAYIEDLMFFAIKFKNESIFETNTNSVVAIKNCVTRSNNENYPLTKNIEIQAEVTMQLWRQLDINQCPEHFKINFLRITELEIFKALDNPQLLSSLLHSTNNDNSQRIYDSLKLQKLIIQMVQNAIGNILEDSKEKILRYSDCYSKLNSNSKVNLRKTCVQGCYKNKPRKMEDRHICLPRYSEIFQIEEQFSFYGIFDGHSGTVAATYASNHLPYLLAKQLKSNNKNKSYKYSDHYRESFENAFLETDKNFNEKLITSGTTAVCALLKQSENMFVHLYVAWVGDSKALLVAPTMHLQLVKPHKPESIDERSRIETQEIGSVIYVEGHWRVNGFINVSRSIGDYSIKSLIAEPDFVDVPIQKDHDFLILGSDGLWDHISEELIVETVYTYLQNEKFSLDDITKRLIELAKHGDSTDNITVILILLKDIIDIVRNYSKYCCV